MTPPTNTEGAVTDVAAIARITGLRIIESHLLVVGPFEDWSQVRSRGRAARRRAKHPQRIRFYTKPDPNFIRYGDTLVGHPVTVAALRHRLTEQGVTAS